MAFASYLRVNICNKAYNYKHSYISFMQSMLSVGKNREPKDEQLCWVVIKQLNKYCIT